MASVASANRMVDAELGVAAHVAPTTPIRVQLASAAGTTSAAGTAIANPAAVTVTFGASSAGVAASTNAPSLTNTSGSAVTVTGVNIIDSAGTPRFLGYGGLTGGSKTLNNNDVLSFAIGQITYGVTPAA
jgi:hypothetical protein